MTKHRDLNLYLVAGGEIGPDNLDYDGRTIVAAAVTATASRKFPLAPGSVMS